MSLQILILMLVFYFVNQQWSMLYYVAPGYPRKTQLTNHRYNPSRYGMCPTTIVPLHVATSLA